MEKPNSHSSPRKLGTGERLSVFIPDRNFVWLGATCDPNEEPDEEGKIEFVVDDASLGENRGEKRRFKASMLNALPLQNLDMPKTGVQDMCDLGFLHEASILDNLHRRFGNSLPYTRSGEICIAVNPYKWLDIYGEESMKLYASKLRHELPPHVFATSAEAYRSLKEKGTNQSILVSGESGAGKTETVKIMLNMLALVSSPPADSNSDSDSEGGSSSSASFKAPVVEKIISANPLLESFGNAKTARNDNSSRFGKLLELQFEEKGADLLYLSGSKCT
jgi:myosin-5